VKKLYIFDTTLRDGEKSLGITLNAAEKLEISRQLVKLGVDVIEAGYPAFSPFDLEAVRTIAREVKEAVICGFSRAEEKDIDYCAEALREAAQPRIHTGIGISPRHMGQKQLSPAQVLETAVSAVKHAKKYVSDVQFYAEDAFNSHRPFLVEIIEKVIEAGATVVNIPDTAGYATPWEYNDLICHVMNNVKNINQAMVSIHCHNDLGMATANALAGIRAGAVQVEGTINGIGERAGNTSLEEAIMAIYTRRYSYGIKWGINTKEISATSRLVERVTGVAVPGHKAIVGTNALKRVPIIDQSYSSQAKTAYEMIEPDLVGLPKSGVVLSANTGRSEFMRGMEKLGYCLGKEDLESIYEKFLMLAGKKKEVVDEDLHLLIDESREHSEKIIVRNISVTTNGVSRATATVTLDLGGETVTDAACGYGPVDAVFKAVDLLVGEQVCLEGFSLKSVSRGRESLGDATVKVRYGDDGHVVGRGASTDVIEASAKAYVNALTKVKIITRENTSFAR